MLKANKTNHEKFLHAYIECALWSSSGDDDDNLEGHTLADDTLKAMERDCLAFWVAHEEHISSDPEQAGRDFWLTRCGHGAGFWDGDWQEPAASILTEASNAFGSVDLYVGDDGFIYA